MAARLTTKATTQPTTRTAISVPVIAAPERTNLTTLSRDAPAIAGMAKKVNSATGTGQTQQQTAPMVAPGEEVPDVDQHLPHADDEGFAVGDLFQSGDMRGGAAVLHKDEEDTIQDQHGGGH